MAKGNDDDGLDDWVDYIDKAEETTGPIPGGKPKWWEGFWGPKPEKLDQSQVNAFVKGERKKKRWRKK